MGRIVRMVDNKTKLPIGVVWEGYVNPYYKHYKKCPKCNNGWSLYGRRLNDEWYGNVIFNAADIGAKPLTIDSKGLRDSVIAKISKAIEVDGPNNYYTKNCFNFEEAVETEIKRMFKLTKNSWMHQLSQQDVDALVKGERLWEFTHSPHSDMDLEEHIRTRAYYLWQEAGQPFGQNTKFWEEAKKEYSKYPLPYPTGYHPTADEVNYWSFFRFGHDSINMYTCIRARAEREGENIYCDHCNGEGKIWESETFKNKAFDWKPTDPPEGEYYQIWETVSEGSPISPAFKKPEDLAQWMVENDDSTTSDVGFEEWLTFIKNKGWACGGVNRDGIMTSGVKYVTSSV